MTENLILIIHVLIALAIIGLILLQQGKGAEAGASFGAGASQTIFGSAGSWNFFSKMTAILATLFFITSFGLAIMAKDKATVTEGPVPGLEEIERPVETESEVPVVDDAADVADEEIPEPVVDESKTDEPEEGKK